MAQQVIEGTKEQLRPYFEQQSSKQKMTLIIAEQEAEAPEKQDYLYSRDAEMRNGVPLFPTEGREGVVTTELVEQIIEDEDNSEQKAFSYPRDAVRFHGIPIIPKQQGMQMLTLEKVKESLEEDD